MRLEELKIKEDGTGEAWKKVLQKSENQVVKDKAETTSNRNIVDFVSEVLEAIHKETGAEYLSEVFLQLQVPFDDAVCIETEEMAGELGSYWTDESTAEDGGKPFRRIDFDYFKQTWCNSGDTPTTGIFEWEAAALEAAWDRFQEILSGDTR